MPIKSRVLSELFLAREVARTHKLPSSVISLFFEISSVTIPSLHAINVAKVSNP